MIKSKIGWEWSQDTLASIISRIIERYNDTEDEMDDDFNKGRNLAYYEILDIIKNDLEVRGFDLEDLLKK